MAWLYQIVVVSARSFCWTLTVIPVRVHSIGVESTTQMSSVGFPASGGEVSDHVLHEVGEFA